MLQYIKLLLLLLSKIIANTHIFNKVLDYIIIENIRLLQKISVELELTIILTIDLIFFY